MFPRIRLPLLPHKPSSASPAILQPGQAVEVSNWFCGKATWGLARLANSCLTCCLHVGVVCFSLDPEATPCQSSARHYASPQAFLHDVWWSGELVSVLGAAGKAGVRFEPPPLGEGAAGRARGGRQEVAAMACACLVMPICACLA